MNICVVMPVTETHIKILKQVAPSASFYFGKDLTKLEQAEIIIGNVSPQIISRLPNLKWLQLNSAGAGSYCKKGILSDNTLLTNATGAYGTAVSEHIMALLLAMMKRLYQYYEQKESCIWKDRGTVKTIKNSVVLIVGFGDIGRTFAGMVKAMGAYVIGIRRRSKEIVPEADEMGTMDFLDAYLPRADIVVSILPDTSFTRKIYNKKRFEMMKKGSYFINAGRGNAVVQEDLLDSLNNHHLAGAAIDVADPEPLLADSPLWSTPNLYITPHISGGLHTKVTWDGIIKIAAENLSRYKLGQPLLNQVDRIFGYKK